MKIITSIFSNDICKIVIIAFIVSSALSLAFSGHSTGDSLPLPLTITMPYSGDYVSGEVIKVDWLASMGENLQPEDRISFYIRPMARDGKSAQWIARGDCQRLLSGIPSRSGSTELRLAGVNLHPGAYYQLLIFGPDEKTLLGRSGTFCYE